MKPVSYREKVRSAFWELTIGTWVITATIAFGGTIAAAVVTRDYEDTLVFFLAVTAIGAISGPLVGMKLTPLFVQGRQMRDRYEAEMDALDPPVSDEDSLKGGPLR